MKTLSEALEALNSCAAIIIDDQNCAVTYPYIYGEGDDDALEGGLLWSAKYTDEESQDYYFEFYRTDNDSVEINNGFWVWTDSKGEKVSIGILNFTPAL